MLPEARYADLFKWQFGGRREVHLRYGRADVVTSRYVVEVEPFTRWRDGLRQTLAYAAMSRHLGTDRAPALAVYGDLSPQEGERLYLKIDGIATLFLLRGVAWQTVGSRDAARRATPSAKR